MDSILQRIKDLGIELPKVPAPIGNFAMGVVDDGRLYLSGQGPLRPDGTLATGKVGTQVSAEQAYQHARYTGLVLIAAMKEMLGSLDRVDRVVKLLGMVNADPGFTDHPKVINGCSDLLVEVFGQAGVHARSAVGMSSLPGNITVEIEAIVAVKPE